MRRARWIAPVAAIVVLLTGGALYAERGAPDDGGTPLVTDAPQPVVEGNRLVDARSGDPFVPRGVNWSSFEYACAQGWGMSSLDTLGGPDAYDAEAAAIAGWGANTVRLPLNQDCWLGTRGAPVSDQFEERTPHDYRAAVHDFVTALNRHGMVVVLDLHSRKRMGEPEFGNLAMPDSESLAFWRSVAGVYRANPSVMFDAFNEPYSRYNAVDRIVFDLTWECWRDGGCAAPVEDDQTATAARITYPVQGMATVVREIRDAGAGQPVLLGGLDYANDLSHWSTFAPDDDQLVASFHAYDFKECADQRCWDAVLAPLAARVPVLTGELGSSDPANGFVERFLEWADRHGIGSLFWVWADHPTDPMSLVRDDLAGPTSYGVIARRSLRGS
ncbi:MULTISPECIES: glycoside hydrolase family 5 protein [unclassified Nocardioides]|uniref:glycoside hydrolase family 5 protein n=1 Tax=unclassified Nocardioides TaxID=2615069 RepID=UPI00361B6005